MWRIIQQLRVLQYTLDLAFQRLRWVDFMDSMMTVNQTYSPENHESFQTRGEDHEDRRWKVANDPNKDHRELCQRDGRHARADCFNNVSLKIRER